MIYYGAAQFLANFFFIFSYSIEYSRQINISDLGLRFLNFHYFFNQLSYVEQLKVNSEFASFDLGVIKKVLN